MAKQKASETGQGGILVRTHGQYYYKTDTQKGIRSFTKEVRFPSMEIFRETVRKYVGTKINPDTKLSEPQYAESSIINIRGLLKRRFMPILLAREFPDFARIRFVSIDEVVGSGTDLPINLRSREQLRELLAAKSIPINVDEYLDIDELRSDIFDYFESPDSFLAAKPHKDRIRSEERAFMAMNQVSDTLPPRKDTIEKPRSVVDEL